MKNALSLFILCAFGPVFLFAQAPIKGTVQDAETGAGIPAVTIAIPGTGRQTITDDAGVFELNSSGVTTGAKILALCVGYQKDSFLIENLAKPVRFSLRPLQTQINEVVVSGTMKAVSRMQSPVPVEVYTPRFFRKNPTPSLFAAMENVNGVRPQLNCSVCNTGDIHINGMEGPYTMVLIDGMPIVSGLSTVYGLNGIPNTLIDRVEIVKGPASTLYGSEAVGGLINVITKNPATAPALSVDVNGTSYGELNADAGMRGRVGKASVLLSGNYFHFQQRLDRNADNFTDMTLQKRFTLFNKWQYDRTDRSQTSLALRYIWENRFGGELQWKPEFRGGDSIYGEQISTRRFEMLGSHSILVPEKIKFAWSYTVHDQASAYGTTIFDARQHIAFGQTTWDKKIGNLHDALFGVALRYTWYDDNTPITTRPNQPGQTAPSITWLPGIFVQDQIDFSQKHTLLTGMRYDYNSVHGHIFTPRINYQWKPNANHTLRFTIGNGYRVANVFSEDHAALTGAREVVIAEALRPERSWNTNLNYTGQFVPQKSKVAFVGLDATLFYTRFSNRIVADYLSDPQKVIFDNLQGFGISRGFSLNSDANFTNGLKMMAGITVLDVYTQETNLTGNTVKTPQLHASPFSGTFSISFPLYRNLLSIDYTGNVYGPMPLPVVPNDFRPANSPWFSIQNIQATWNIRKGLECYGGAKNLLNFVPKDPILRPFDPFDKQANDPVGNPNGYTFDPSYNYAPIQGIRFFIGLRYTSWK